MPLLNATSKTSSSISMFRADSILTRMAGLLGYKELDDAGIQIIPTKSIHTWGMDFPVDLIWLDKKSIIRRLDQNISPGKFVKGPPGSHSVLELPKGFLAKQEMKVGDHLILDSPEPQKYLSRAFGKLFYWPVNIAMGFIWGNFAFQIFLDFQNSHSIKSLGLVIINSLFAFFFLTRRPSTRTSTRPLDWIIPLLAILASFSLRPADTMLLPILKYPSQLLQFFGVILIIFSLCSLGRSFGIIAADRTIQRSRAYSLVRHPLYASEFIFYIGFYIGNITTANSVLILFILATIIYRAGAEESLLAKNSQYRHYLDKVRYRLIPGIY